MPVTHVFNGNEAIDRLEAAMEGPIGLRPVRIHRIGQHMFEPALEVRNIVVEQDAMFKIANLDVGQFEITIDTAVDAVEFTVGA